MDEIRMKLLFFFSTLTLSAAAAKFEFREEWNLWKAQHGKSYNEGREELERHIVWLSNRKFIEHHNINADIFGFTLAMNKFGDMTDAEFLERYGTYQKVDYTKKLKGVKVFEPPTNVNYPDTLDWRTMNAVTAVKDQGDCGSSYAFSAVGAMEGVTALAFRNLYNLSEQNIIDCSRPNGNYGCRGGNMYNAFMYVLENEGINTASVYPYQGTQGQCSYNHQYVATDITGSIAIKSGSETDLFTAVFSVGPVSVATDASRKSFWFYSSGVYDSSRCSSYDLNHAMLVTGYGTNSDIKYWLVKNSWGKGWGMNGYIMMSRDRYNQCGIATDASYPTL